MLYPYTSRKDIYFTFLASVLNCGLRVHCLTSVSRHEEFTLLQIFLCPIFSGLLHILRWSEINRGTSVLFIQWPWAPGGIEGAILSLMMFYISKSLALFDIKEWNVQCNCYCFMTFNRLIRLHQVFHCVTRSTRNDLPHSRWILTKGLNINIWGNDYTLVSKSWRKHNYFAYLNSSMGSRESVSI